MRFVLDASVALSWCFDDEYAPVADLALSTLEDGREALAPSLWRVEVANVLALAERKKRITPAESTQFLELLKALPIHVVSDHRAVADILAVARQFELTAYDATYLDLAMRDGAPLATLDARLATAVRTAGGVLFGG